jgi:hypothetical protein
MLTSVVTHPLGDDELFRKVMEYCSIMYAVSFKYNVFLLYPVVFSFGVVGESPRLSKDKFNFGRKGCFEKSIYKSCFIK